MPEDQSRQEGFWHRVFGYNKPTTTAPARPVNPQSDVTPLPGSGEVVASPQTQEKPTEPQPAPQPITTFNRYHYKSPPKPAAGDRRSADGAFTKARMAEQDENLVDAEQWYQSAADFDPSWFEAQYNGAITAQRLGNYSVALPRFEMALAIQPESLDARYNFALALKTMGYALDAAAELKKILAAHPDEVRAHLALANLYAQTIHDIPQAKQHYLRVLALQPDNPHAAEIRFWLSANGK
jgi:tetratricopeptide (TPR) repeat protein